MSITIHHGPNGSFKTAGVVNDYFIPAALEGRTVVTNIRGISRENTILHLPDTPESFEVVFIDTDTRDGRYRIATWFHWAPLGALLLFDESGVMFPKAWRDSDIKKLDFPGGVEAASEAGRPANWVEAWEMHRHYNWDIVLTAPNIRSIRDDIRQTTEGAYKHKNKAVLGPMFKGYKEGYHDAQKNGQSASDFDVVRDKRVANIVFRLYQSTKTGKAQGTLNGFNLFTSPRLLLALGVAVLAFGYTVASGGYSLLFEKSDREIIEDPFAHEQSLPDPAASQAQPAVAAAVPAAVEVPSVDPVKALAAAFDNAGADVADRAVHQVNRLDSGPLSGSLVFIAGAIKKGHQYTYLLTFVSGDQTETLISTDVEPLGYRIYPKGNCNASIWYEQSKYLLSCVSVAAR